MATTELNLDSTEQIVVPTSSSSSEGVALPVLESPPPVSAPAPDTTDLPAVAEGAVAEGAGAGAGAEAEDDPDSYNGSCDCLECRTGHNPDAWHQNYYDDREDYYDDGAGVDWNESGYFD